MATFSATRPANRASRIAERSLLATLRPVRVYGPIGDPMQKIGFADDHWVHIEGPRAVFDVTADAACLAFGLRNARRTRHGWHDGIVADREDPPERADAPGVTLGDVRAWALSLPRTEEHLIRDYVKFRVGRIVYAAVSPDESILGFGFPKEERAALIAAEPARFLLERPSDQRYNWIDARMAMLGRDEAREFITDAWRMVVPRRVAAAIGLAQPRGTQST